MARFRVTYRDGSAPSEISVGAFAQIAAKRRYGAAALQEDPECGLFAAFVEVVGPAAAVDPEAFDIWLQRVEDLDPIDAPSVDEDPTKAEESNASSLASPPTSASVPTES